MPAAAVPLIAGAAAGAGAYAAVTAVTVGMALSIGTAVATATMMLTTKKPSLSDYRSASERSPCPPGIEAGGR